MRWISTTQRCRTRGKPSQTTDVPANCVLILKINPIEILGRRLGEKAAGTRAEQKSRHQKDSFLPLHPSQPEVPAKPCWNATVKAFHKWFYFLFKQLLCRKNQNSNYKPPSQKLWEGSRNRSQPLTARAYFCTCALVKKISQEAPHNCLVADNEDVALTFQLHNYRLQALNQVLVGLKKQNRSFARGFINRAESRSSN